MDGELYKIEWEIRKCFDEETGEILDIERLETLELSREQRIEQLILLRKELAAQIVGIKSEVDDLNAKIDSRKHKIEQIDSWVDSVCAGVGFVSANGLYEVKYTPSKETEVFDLKALMDFDKVGVFYKYGDPKPAA